MPAAGEEGAEVDRPVINVGNFLRSWGRDVKDLTILTPDQKENEQVAKRLGITTDLVNELSLVCGAQTLCCGDEPIDTGDLLKMRELPDDIDLTTVNYQKSEVQRRNLIDYKLFAINKMKYRMADVQPVVRHAGFLNRDAMDVDSLVPVPNVVLTVKIYRARNYNATVLPKGEIFQVLGTQFLTELKDAISCMKDDAIAGEFSSYPNIPNDRLTPARMIYKSGMFFIENVFYNDMREPDNKNYSTPILQWAVQKEHQNCHLFRTAKMEDTQFVDLNVQLGLPYLYLHQGHCEHIIVFSDMRLLHCDDPQDKALYPFLLSETVNKRTVCRACHIESVRWTVYDSPLTPESPCFMCHSCHQLLHYDHYGQKVCSFRAFIYPQKRSFY